MSCHGRFAGVDDFVSESYGTNSINSLPPRADFEICENNFFLFPFAFEAERREMERERFFR